MVVSVYSGSRMMELLDTVDAFTLSVCAADMKPAAQWLGQPGQPQYGLLSGIPTAEVLPGFPPGISGSIAAFACEINDRHQLATHTLVAGTVRAYHGERKAPMVRWNGDYGTYSPAKRA